MSDFKIRVLPSGAEVLQVPIEAKIQGGLYWSNELNQALGAQCNGGAVMDVKVKTERVAIGAYLRTATATCLLPVPVATAKTGVQR